MKTYEYSSVFAPYIEGLIECKRSNGFKYNNASELLLKFDEFIIERHPEATVITKYISDEWCTRRPTEGSSHHGSRISVLRQLAIYMTSLGVDSYIAKDISSKEKPILTIPSSTDIEELFSVVDNRKTDKKSYRSIYAYRIMFRLYYCCGLRRSEAGSLRREDMDLANMTITIRSSKGFKDRIVYLPDDARELLSGYVKFISELFPLSPYVFPGKDPLTHITGGAIDAMFRDCWGKTKASKKYAKPPTVHCLRHAFVVDRINKWAAEGIDFTVMLPYLSKYLGHACPSETFYYYHMVESAFSTIITKGAPTTDVIPEVKPYEE